MDDLPHCIMAVCWVNGQPVALAEDVGQAASGAAVLAAGLCKATSTSPNVEQH